MTSENARETLAVELEQLRNMMMARVEKADQPPSE